MVNLFDTPVLSDMRYALRGFRRHPLVALTVVGTVGLGLAMVAVVFTFYSALFLRPDEVFEPSRIFAVERPVREGSTAWKPFTVTDFEALRRETSVFADVFGIVRNVNSRVDGRRTTSALVSGNFFAVLGVRAAAGRVFQPSDDLAAAPPVAVLSHKGWLKLFPGDHSVVGRRFVVAGTPFEVVGVMPSGFRGLGPWPPDFWAPIGAMARLRGAGRADPDDVQLDDVVGRLQPAISREAATASLRAWAAERAEPSPRARVDPKALRLTPRRGTVSESVAAGILRFAPLFFAFGLILLIGCANVANLLLARGVARRSEIGMRLSLGASRSRLVRQLLTESLILAIAAATVGFWISRLLLAGAFAAALKALPPEIGESIVFSVPPQDWRLIVFLLAGAIGATLSFGLLPALQATRIQSGLALGDNRVTSRNTTRARNMLIGVQVGASTMLLVCAFVFLRSTFSESGPTVLRTSDTVVVPIGTEDRRLPLLNALSTHPLVAMVAASEPSAGGPFRSAVLGEATASDTNSAPRRLSLSYQFVSSDYFDVLGIEILAGRKFTSTERTSHAGVVVVSQRAATRLWPAEDPIGRTLRLDAGSNKQQPASQTYEVVGIARDVGDDTGFSFSGPSIYLPATTEREGTDFIVRVHGDSWAAREVLLRDITRADPAATSIRTLKTSAGIATLVLRFAFWVTGFLGILALVLTVSGLFSILSYLAQQRTMEIGVRMAVGASKRDVVWLILSQAVRPIGFGLVAGAGVAALLSTILISTPVAALVSSRVNVFDPLAYGGSAIVIIVACILAGLRPALRASRVDPIATLRAL